MLDAEQMLARQRVLAGFGELTLRSSDMDAVLNEACRLVGEALGTRRAKVLEIEDKGKCLFVRAGVGWDTDVVGKLRLPMNKHSSETYSIEAGEPVITQDIRKEDRFDIPAFMKEAGVVALANVPIFLPGGRLYGLLEVDDTRPREFEAEDTEFLRTYAMILGPVIDRLLTVKALKRTEQRYRYIVEMARDYAIFVTDEEDRITDWLAGAEAVFGWSADEALGQPASILFTQADRETREPGRETETAVREGVAPDVRWHLRKDGRRVFIEGSVTALRDDNGSLLGFIKIGRDVTERKRAERALRDNEERLRIALKVGRLASWDWNLRTNEIAWSEEHFWMLGYVPGELKPSYEAWSARVHPDDLAPTEAALREARESRQSYVRDFRYVHPDGRIVWCTSQGQYFYDDDGHAVRMIGVMQDVTAQVQARESLRESEERLRQFGEASSDVLWIRDARNLQWEYLTPAFETINGVSREATAAAGDNFLSWLDVVVPEDRERIQDEMRRLLAGERRTYEFRIERPTDGEIRWLRDTDFPMLDADGRVLRIGGICQDFTALKKAEQHQRLLLSELQHRVRNTLAVIRSIIRRTARTSDTVEDFAMHLEGRVDAFARVQSAVTRNPAAGVDLASIIADEFLATGTHEGRELSVRGPELRLRPKAAETLGLAIHELATNAMKHGALSGTKGHVEVGWRISDGKDKPVMTLEWREAGANKPTIPPQRRGFGTEILERTLAYELKGRTRLAFEPTGLRCEIEIPLKELVVVYEE